MNKIITSYEAHKQLVAAIGKYGWFPLNDYLEMKSIILFGDKDHKWITDCGFNKFLRDNGYVPNIEEALPGKTIEEAIKLYDNELVISIRRLVTKKGSVVWGLNILPMGPGYVCGWEHGIMNTGYDSIEDCLKAIETRKDAIVEKAIDSKALYITGDEDAVKKVEEMLSGLLWTTLPIRNK